MECPYILPHMENGTIPHASMPPYQGVQNSEVFTISKQSIKCQEAQTTARRPVMSVSHESSHGGKTSGFEDCESGTHFNIKFSKKGVIAESSICFAWHHYCFRTAQALFVAGIGTGLSLAVAGAMFYSQQGNLQVLMYIGGLISLVCLVLLIIFCVINRQPIPRKSPYLPSTVRETETMPLRTVEIPLQLPMEDSKRNSQSQRSKGKNKHINQR
ncbi:unnamed protein product, partial [Meganyctiphanes norvegica]